MSAEDQLRFRRRPRVRVNIPNPYHRFGHLHGRTGEVIELGPQRPPYYVSVGVDLVFDRYLAFTPYELVILNEGDEGWELSDEIIDAIQRRDEDWMRRRSDLVPPATSVHFGAR